MSYYEETLDRSKLRYVLYVRKSSEDEDAQSHSIPAQINDCMRVAEREGLNIVDVLREEKSAKIPHKREVFKQMLKDIEEGRYDGILCWHPDRLSRNMLESGMIIDLLDNAIIQDLRFFSHQFSNDANGKMLLGMLFVFSKQYSEGLSEKVTMGNKQNLRSGVGSGAPRWGYDRDEITGHYLPNEHFDLIQKGWLMRANGETITNVIKYWKTHGVVRKTKLSRKNKSIREIYPSQSGATKMFRHPFYYGILEQAGQEVDLRKPPFNQQHVSMVSEEVWDTVQALSYSRSRMKPRASKKDIFYPLRGLVFCGVCKSDTPMRTGKNKSGGGGYSLTYRCDTKGCKRTVKSVRAKYVLEGLYETLDKLKFTDKEYDTYSNKLAEMTEERIDEVRSEIRILNGAKSNKSRQVDDIARSMRKFDKEDKAYEVAQSDLEELQSDIIDIDAQLAKLEPKVKDPTRLRMAKEDFLNLANTASDKMRAGTPVEKDILARKMLLNLTLDNERAPSFIWKEPFATLLNSRKYSSGADERT